MTPERHDPPPRVVIDAVTPEIDGGRYPAKTTIGERFTVQAHLFADGHDRLQGSLLYRSEGTTLWCEIPLLEEPNDVWVASLLPEQIGRYGYTIVAWVDRFGTWLHDLERRVAAGWDVTAEWQDGAELLRTLAARADGIDHVRLLTAARWLDDTGLSLDGRLRAARDDELAQLARVYRDRQSDTAYREILPLIVDRARARWGAWYELFPRSMSPDPARGGTLRDAATRLPELAQLGFDVLYLPPIHPIGTTNRKGANNALVASPGDPGSPWAIGSEAGGHTAIDPALGTLEDFDWFVRAAEAQGIEIALDLAFQCSPDHPWVREHPQWFRRRADGSIRYAENPPKQYQDIYPLDFETDDWEALWRTLHDVVLFWIEYGVRIFRVDNPHTKPYPFWEWLIGVVRDEHPDVLFLAEAFTRPKRMAALAKLGFSQSYSYFTWRNTKQEVIDYFTELNSLPLAAVMRPNLFVNTPDILHAYLQQGGRPAFVIRLVLAATLGPSYGMYSGFELVERAAAGPASEEYLNSEKYQLRPRDWDAPGNLKQEIARLNAVRRAYPALQHSYQLWFLPIANDQIVVFMKADPGGGQRVVVAVSLDPFAAQEGWFGLPLEALGLAENETFVVRELLDDQGTHWRGEWQHVRLDPARPARLFAIEGRLTAGLGAEGGVLP